MSPSQEIFIWLSIIIGAAILGGLALLIYVVVDFIRLLRRMRR